jgi:hypothetical protein
MEIRRAVTGHDGSGKAVVKTDERITGVPRIAVGISGCEIWPADRMPIGKPAAAEAASGLVSPCNTISLSRSGRRHSSHGDCHAI